MAFDQNFDDPFDIVIAGAGYVGACLAVSIKQAAPHLSVLLVDPAPQGAHRSDPRASAIAAAAGRMLNRLGIWQQIYDDSQPITEMVVTDSQLSDPVRPPFLTFSGAVQGNEDGEDNNETAFAHMVPNAALLSALFENAAEAGVKFAHGAMLTDFSRQDGQTLITLSQVSCEDKIQLKARLLVACDGVNSRLRSLSGIKTVRVPYDQMGIVTTVRHDQDHKGRAYEHFLPAGPFATLPLPPNDGAFRSSIVWTEKTHDAERLLTLDDFEFGLELEQRFGAQFGEVLPLGPRKAYPLGLTLARSLVKEGFALAGDAAHGIHPIAGQGLNLGFKDVAALAQTIVEADRLGLDFASVTSLERYERWRRFDIVQMGVTTDILNRLFSTDNALLTAARDLGLSAVERMPALKRMFIGQAANSELTDHENGTVAAHVLSGGADQPHLLQGKAI